MTRKAGITEVPLTAEQAKQAAVGIRWVSLRMHPRGPGLLGSQELWAAEDRKLRELVRALLIAGSPTQPPRRRVRLPRELVEFGARFCDFLVVHPFLTSGQIQILKPLVAFSRACTEALPHRGRPRVTRQLRDQHISTAAHGMAPSLIRRYKQRARFDQEIEEILASGGSLLTGKAET